MYRQATLLRETDLTVVAYRYLQRDLFPVEGFRLEMVRGNAVPSGGAAARQVKFACRALQNARCGGYRGAPAEVRWWRQLHARRPADVALVQYGTTAVELAPLLRRLGVPMVGHFHGADLSGELRKWWYRHRLARLAPRLAACVVVADYMSDWLRGRGVQQGRIYKIPCGTPIAQLAVAERVGESPCRCVAVGRLVEKKRPDLTIRAFAEASGRAPDATLTLIGDGPMKGACEELVRGLGLADRVTLLGAQPPEVVFRHLAGAGLFVQHSVRAANGDKEGWPVSIAEAAGSGLPVVSTRHASIPDQVEEGVTGLLCDEGDWRTMAGNLAQLISHPQRRRQMGHAARQKLAAFDTQRQVQRLQRVLHAAAGRPGCGLPTQ